MKKLFWTLYLSFLFVVAHSAIIWTFDTDLEGWGLIADNVDVTLTQQSGKMHVAYVDGAGGAGYAPLNSPNIIQDGLSIDASSIDIFKMGFVADWPVPSGTLMPILITFTVDAGLSYSFFNLDMATGYVEINIRDNDPTWGVPLAGTITRIQIDLPHNSGTNFPNGDLWFSGSYMDIDSIELAPATPVLDDSFWTFDADLQGWYTNSNELDLDIAWEEGNLVMNYTDNGVGNQDMVWFPQIYKDVAFSSESYSYLNIYYDAVDWPKTEPALALIAFDNSAGRSYFTFNLDPKAKSVSVDLNGSYNPGWSTTPYSGNFDKITIELPHNSYTSGDMASWFDKASTRIDKIELSNTLLEPEVTDSLTAYWSFDANFTDDISNITGVAGGTPEIIEADAKIGNGALVLEGDYLTMPASDVFSSDDITFTFWMKTPAAGQGVGVKANVISFENSDFMLSLKDGEIFYEGYRGSLIKLASWQDGVWNHVTILIKNKTDLICYINGRKSAEKVSTLYSARIEKFVLGSPELSATIDELSIYNYGLYISRSEIQDQLDTPPTTNDTITSYNANWDEVLAQSAVNKSGIGRFNNPQFMYQPIGLGGTVLRADPWGFAFNKAPGATTSPYYGYEYWWDNTGHRLNPFDIKSGYGTSFTPGEVSAFEQNMDIRTGVLQTKLTLNVNGTVFTTERETFVTPDGVLVIRVKDNGAPLPLQLSSSVNQSINWGGTYYAGEEEQYVKENVHSENRLENANTHGGVLVATRTNSATGALAVAVETSAGEITANSGVYSSSEANGILTFYIAPASSFNPATPDNPWDIAWNAAYAAKQTGFDALKLETANWWSGYMNTSSVLIPDGAISKLYAQSLYYHGVYFGNSNIPPGCFGTDVNGFFGGVCPEYDLSFSSFALAYTGHINETKNIADWIYTVLPKCKEQATNGVWHHDVFRKYNDGAIYTTIMGYDGTITFQGEPFEGSNLLQNYPGLNSARMALNYLDYSDDQSFKDAAHDVLKSTTYIALEDLVSDASGEAYLDGRIPNCMQESTVIMGYNQCVKRGIAEPEWITKYQDKILMSQGVLNGDAILSAGVGHNPGYGEGGATWLYPLWWATIIDKHDSRAVKAVDNFDETFQGYNFNNGWTGVHCAKVYRGDDALMWLKNFQRTDVLIDETVFTENNQTIWTTPEIGAHGAYICNLTQMLIDPDNDSIIDVFPAIPDEWEYQKISFEDLMTTGALAVTAERNINGAKVVVENRSNSVRKRIIRTKIPKFVEVVGQEGLTIEDGFIVETISLEAREIVSFEYVFNVDLVETGIETASNEITMDETVAIYPNPCTTGVFNISGSEDVDDVLIFSINGKLVKRFQHQRNSLNIGDLQSGIYLVQIIANGDFCVKRLIIN